ncbi:MAG: hypothetical protein OXC60_04245 [Litoreibacter sp.]|nr:hypothetical protein [Litoreibacter sp.]
MEVSHFELIFKPQSPAGPADTVLQGHFLEITNLEDQALSFRLDYITSSTTDPDRSLFDNTFVIVDTPDDNNNFNFSLTGGPTAKRYRLNPLVTIEPCATALVAVLPSDPFSMPGCPPPTPNFEARGFIELSLPAQLQIVQGPLGPQFTLVPQADGPVRVLLTPQNRATYFAEDGTITDQTQASVPTATGAALNEVIPQTGFAFPGLGASLDLQSNLEALAPDDVSPERLAAMLAMAQASGMDMGAFNKSLKASGVGLAVETRKLESPTKAKKQKETA